MHSIRTNLNSNHKSLFKLFCKDNNLDDLLVGEYRGKDGHIYMCYAYSDMDVDLCAALTCIMLKYASLELFYKDYIVHYINQQAYGN